MLNQLFSSGTIVMHLGVTHCYLCNLISNSVLNHWFSSGAIVMHFGPWDNLIGDPSISITTFAFRSSEVRCLLLDLDPHDGTDPLGMFLLFLKRTADVIAPRLSLVFPLLVRLGSFPACWRQANVTPIPKGPPSSSVANY